MGNNTSISVAANNGTYNSTIGNRIDVTGIKYMIPPQPSEKLPELWEVPEKNKNFIGRDELLKQIEHHYSQTNTHAILTARHGLGGIGKTQVALEFVWLHYRNYNGVVWFNAEDLDQLHKNYISLGRELNIFRDEGNIEAEELARYVKHWLENPLRDNWLLVYDNAPNYETIRKLLPTKNGKILITSRYTKGWPHEKISIDVFSITESRDYVQKVLDRPLLAIDTTHIDTLAEELGRLPLALAIAFVYIKNNKMSISSYLELYEQRKQHILSKMQSLKSDILLLNSYDKKQFISVYITWDITMDEIRRKYILAVKWLNTCACLASNDIPHFLFEKFANTPENSPVEGEVNLDLKYMLETLSNYSILEINKQNLSTSIHSLVQEVIRFNWGAEEKRNNYIAVLNLLKYSVPNTSETQEAYAKKRQLLPHLEAFLPHLDVWEKEEIYLEGIRLSEEWNTSLGNARKALERMKQGLLIEENIRDLKRRKFMTTYHRVFHRLRHGLKIPNFSFKLPNLNWLNETKVGRQTFNV